MIIRDSSKLELGQASVFGWKPAIHRSLAISSLLLMACPHSASGQTAALKQVAERLEPAKPKAQDVPEDARARMAQWDQEARDTLARMDAPAAATTLPAGISAEEFDERRRDLEQTVLATTRSLKNFSVVEDARKALDASRSNAAAWTGFKQNPPYSLLLIDDLLTERAALSAALGSFTSSLANYQRLLASVLAETKIAEDAVSSALGQLRNAAPAVVAAAKWRLDAARGHSRMLALRAGLIQSLIDSYQDRIATAKIDLALLDRQVKLARTDACFSDEDFSKLSKISAERKQAIRKDLDAVSKKLKAALATRSQAQAALSSLTSTPAATAPPAAAAAESPGLELAKYRLEVAEGRVETMQALTEGLESLQQLENVAIQAYQDRRTLVEAKTPRLRAQALDALVVPRENLWAWVNVVDDELARTAADFGKLEARAAAVSSEDPRFALLNEQRAYTGDKLALLQRLSQAVEAQRQLVKRWILEYTPAPATLSLAARLATFATATWSTAKNLWAFKVMSFDDKVEVDGQTITGKIPVTLGMLLRAAVFFLIAYGLCSLIARRLHRGLVARGHLADAQARTLRNWGMIVVGLFLVIATLGFLHIPLTVFAFFGGALAIGLGFGTQSLIKNFISGIIVLVERKVRVGDIVEVDGIAGTIIEINTRSSVLRGADDVETMIPNSVFLDSRVTNRTLSDTRMRRCLRLGVAYGTPPTQVMDILTAAAGRHGLICSEPPPFAVFENFGESSLLFGLYFWLDLAGPGNALTVASDLRLIIEKHLAEAGFIVPFPQRDVHLATPRPLEVQWLASPPP
ncbi:MAG: mechanosensitive ion channel [Verrucomicrobia bacterium]|nr:MAG: mechanosensitive ion channel [Verrucomicrobiota bacterium]